MKTKAKPSRRGLLASATAAVAVMAPAAATALGRLPASAAGLPDDPVFAAIDSHNAAIAAIDAIFEESDYACEDNERMAKIYGALDERLHALLTTMPKTPLGMACVLQHMGTAPSCFSDASDMLEWARILTNPAVNDAAADYLERLGEAMFDMIESAGPAAQGRRACDPQGRPPGRLFAQATGSEKTTLTSLPEKHATLAAATDRRHS
jgi:hypothetical protein